MNTIKNVPARVLSRRSGHSLEAEREQFDKTQQSFSYFTDDLSEKTKENNEQREGIIRLKQEISYMNNELMFSVERANRKDHLLQSAKSKQLRTDTELSNLRQIYLKQQQDLQFLHFSLESSQEAKPTPKKEAHEASIEMVLSDLKNGSDREVACSEIAQKTHPCFVHNPPSSLQPCLICKAENRQQAQDSGSKEQLTTNSDAFQEGAFGCLETLPREEQSQSSSLSAGRVESGPDSQTDSTWTPDERESAQASERNPVTFLPMHEHWLDLDSFMETTKSRSPTSKLSDKFDRCCKAAGADPAGVPGGQSPQTSPRLARALDPGGSCRCSANKTLPHQPITDQEWMQIFKPAKAEGGTQLGALASDSQASCRIKSTKAESSHDAVLTLSDLGPPVLTSTHKSSRPKRREKLLEPDLPSKLASVPEVPEVSGCCCPAILYDSCSPTSKLQKLLAESRQMLADLERNYLLPDAPGCSPQESSPSEWAEEHPGRLPAAEETQMKLSLFSL
ncbi:coiled-coil domain-containing protein 62 [Heteronotia binoei]|uniref:coiled-coil domain-containing protein 62 n=1 Tax=Heteronotia binoei TaxID=13085 RepID=UPI00292EDC68|nr:coiled-coil domain-containing protein 62 [Heteronotia binoei]